MPIIGPLYSTVFYAPIVNLLVSIYYGLTFLHIPFAIGFSIIILTIIIRLALWPFMTKQLQSAKKMAELKPHLEVLKKKHGDNKQALSTAQMALYKEHGINPAGGCLPILLQFAVMIALYQAIYAFFGGAKAMIEINKHLYISSWQMHKTPDLTFFGLNLVNKPSDIFHLSWLIILVPVLTAALQLIQSKMMTPSVPKERASDSPKEKKEKEGMEDAMVSVQSQMLYLIPVMVGYAAFQFPIGLALYWNTSTIFGIIQQYKVTGWGGLASWKNLAQKYIK